MSINTRVWGISDRNSSGGGGSPGRSFSKSKGKSGCINRSGLRGSISRRRNRGF